MGDAASLDSSAGAVPSAGSSGSAGGGENGDIGMVFVDAPGHGFALAIYDPASVPFADRYAPDRRPVVNSSRRCVPPASPSSHRQIAQSPRCRFTGSPALARSPEDEADPEEREDRPGRHIPGDGLPQEQPGQQDP